MLKYILVDIPIFPKSDQKFLTVLESKGNFHLKVYSSTPDTNLLAQCNTFLACGKWITKLLKMRSYSSSGTFSFPKRKLFWRIFTVANDNCSHKSSTMCPSSWQQVNFLNDVFQKLLSELLGFGTKVTKFDKSNCSEAFSNSLITVWCRFLWKTHTSMK